MATSAAVLAIVRAYRPSFRNEYDKLAFAVHSVLCAAGCQLLGVGTSAESAAPTSGQTEEAGIDGWEATAQATPEPDGYYAFAYTLPAGKGTSEKQVLLVKALPVTGTLLVTLVREPCPTGITAQTLELPVDQYCSTSDKTTYSYNNLDQLISQVQTAMQTQMGGASDQAATASTAAAASKPQTRPSQGSEERTRDPLMVGEPRRAAPPGSSYPYQGDPLTVGGNDMYPGGIPRPGRHPELGPLGGSGIGPGGGMHVGPNHPMFAGGVGPRPGFGPGMPGGGPGPGIRWDPINPAGLPGFNPGDFRPGGPGRGGQGIDPDIMQPGPGRGTDWDNMFG